MEKTTKKKQKKGSKKTGIPTNGNSFFKELSASPDTWRLAKSPNYETNIDLEFPYCEYPRTFGPSHSEYEFTSISLLKQAPGSILDFWGEGRLDKGDTITGFTNSYNVNHQFKLVSNPPDNNRKIPNRIPTVDYDNVDISKYVPNDSFDIITLMGAPLYEQTANEMARIINVDSHTVIALYEIKVGDSYTQNLQKALNAVKKNLLISPLYTFTGKLNEIKLDSKARMAFQHGDVIVQSAISYFKNSDIKECVTILISMYKSSKLQSVANDALKKFFETPEIKGSYKIFALGYALAKTTEGLALIEKYMHENVATIVTKSFTSVQIESTLGETAYLCINGKIKTDSYDWAFFGTREFIDNSSTQKGGDVFKIRPTSNKLQFRIQSNFGETSYLCVNGKVPNNEWKWAIFGTPSKLKPANYKLGQYFYLLPINGGEKFRLVSEFGFESFLCVNEKVAAKNYQWGLFGTSNWVDNPSYYNGDLLTLVFT